MNDKDKFESWAIIELFGHQRIAGYVTECSIGGCSFVRVVVPAIGKSQPITKMFGSGAIYAITLVDQDAAVMAAQEIQAEVIPTWSLRHALANVENATHETTDRPF